MRMRRLLSTILCMCKMASSGSSQSSARNASGCSTSSSAPNVTLCCGIPVVKKRNTTSVVWDYFGLKAHSDGGLVSSEAHLPVCRSCGKSVPVKGGNTTNLLAHLRDHHPDLYAEAHPRITKKGTVTSVATVGNKQPTLQQSTDRTSKHPT